MAERCVTVRDEYQATLDIPLTAADPMWALRIDERGLHIKSSPKVRDLAGVWHLYTQTEQGWILSWRQGAAARAPRPGHKPRSSGVETQAVYSLWHEAPVSDHGWLPGPGSGEHREWEGGNHLVPAYFPSLAVIGTDLPPRNTYVDWWGARLAWELLRHLDPDLHRAEWAMFTLARPERAREFLLNRKPGT